MTHIFYIISQVLGVTIIHSLWQGLLIYAVLQVLLLSAPAMPSLQKYKLASFALFSMTAWFVYTFCTESQAYDWSPSKIIYTSPLTAGLNLHVAGPPSLGMSLYNMLKIYFPYISALYAIGFVINLGKLGAALNKIRVIKKTMIAADTLQQHVDSISKQLNIKKRIQVSYSRMVDVPCVVGYFKPVLLLPITLVFQLSTEEIETILLHELSHIKSNDYLVNIVQQIISVVLFFNPFAQFINRIISTERENRCDDLVVETSGNPLTYAYALLKLEEARQGELMLAMAATKNKNHLLTRIERIMKTKQPIGNIRHIVLAVVIFAGSLSSIAWLNPEIKSGKAALKKTVNQLYTAVTTIKQEGITSKVKAPRSYSFKTIPVTEAAVTDTIMQNLNDTTKKAKIKIVVEDENGNKKEYNSVNDMPESVRNTFYKENKDAAFDYGMDYKLGDTSHIHEMNKFYSSPEWKKQMEDIQNKAIAMSAKFNNPEFKKQVEAMTRNAEAMVKKVNSPEFKKQAKEMQKNAEKMALDMQNQFNSADWKKQTEAMEQQGKKMEAYYNSPEWKKQVDELSKQGAEFGEKYVNSPEFKKMQEAIVETAMQMAEHAKEMGIYSKRDFKEKVEKKEAAEKKIIKAKAKKEKAEQKEQPEKPEAPEKPETNN